MCFFLGWVGWREGESIRLTTEATMYVTQYLVIQMSTGSGTSAHWQELDNQHLREHYISVAQTGCHPLQGLINSIEQSLGQYPVISPLPSQCVLPPSLCHRCFPPPAAAATRAVEDGLPPRHLGHVIDETGRLGIWASRVTVTLTRWHGMLPYISLALARNPSQHSWT